MPAREALVEELARLRQRVAEIEEELGGHHTSVSPGTRTTLSANAPGRIQRLRLANALLQSTVTELAGGVAHEINQPLSALTNYTAACVNVLRRGGEIDFETVIEWLGQAGLEARRAGEVIRRLRRIVKHDENERRTCQLEQLVRESVDFMPSTDFPLDAPIETQVPCGGQPTAVECNELQIQQVLFHLLQNASEAMRHLAPSQRRIIVAINQAEGEWIVTVRDTAGPSTLQNEAFEPFFTTKGKLGLGLAICRSIVEAHSGRLWIESATTGTCIAFSLPMPFVGQRPDNVVDVVEDD